MRNALPKVSRVLSSLGFAFGALAAVRLIVLSHEMQGSSCPVGGRRRDWIAAVSAWVPDPGVTAGPPLPTDRGGLSGRL